MIVKKNRNLEAKPASCDTSPHTYLYTWKKQVSAPFS